MLFFFLFEIIFTILTPHPELNPLPAPTDPFLIPFTISDRAPDLIPFSFPDSAPDSKPFLGNRIFVTVVALTVGFSLGFCVGTLFLSH